MPGRTVLRRAKATLDISLADPSLSLYSSPVGSRAVHDVEDFPPPYHGGSTGFRERQLAATSAAPRAFSSSAVPAQHVEQRVKARSWRAAHRRRRHLGDHAKARPPVAIEPTSSPAASLVSIPERQHVEAFSSPRRCSSAGDVQLRSDDAEPLRHVFDRITACCRRRSPC